MQSLIHYYMPKQDQLEKIAILFSLFSDVTRLKIMFGLTISPMCVNDLSVMTGINRTTVSHQLTIMKREGLVKCQTDGKMKIYFIANDLILEILKSGSKVC